MAQNRVEVHIPHTANFTFKVQAGQNVKIGDFVELSGDREVKPAAAGSKKVIGMVYSGSVGIDGVNDGYSGDKGQVATVVVNKPLVYATVTDSAPVAAGDPLKVTSAKRVATLGEDDTLDMKVGTAVTAGGTGQKIVILLG
ncbi:hypothetical protein LEO2_15 [Bacillus phage Leo2]|uniref:DUF2190 family protein n=1 Tax=Bacillus phage Leo2 TaxID=1815973 RepID=A0A1S5QTM5_9CAUD|nr:hypothetical protein LEO2_15 [Bacillus phage Leo2]